MGSEIWGPESRIQNIEKIQGSKMHRIPVPRSGSTTSAADSYPGWIRWFLDPWIQTRDPRWKKIRIWDKHLVSYFQEPGNNFWAKILNYFSVLWIRIWDGKIQIRDKHPGSATLSTTLIFCYSLYAFQPRVFFSSLIPSFI